MASRMKAKVKSGKGAKSEVSEEGVDKVVLLHWGGRGACGFSGVGRWLQFSAKLPS